MGTRIPRGWQYTLESMQLLGVSGYPDRHRYQARVDGAVGRLCGGGSGCTDEELEALQRLADESERAIYFHGWLATSMMRACVHAWYACR